MKFRPRFTIRTLAIIVTLICAYFGAWEATELWGIARFTATHCVGFNRDNDGSPKRRPTCIEISDPEYLSMAKDGELISSLGPFVLSVANAISEDGGFYFEDHPKRRYYLWLCGPTIKLPFEPTEK